ncbi:MAG: hypothetical protein WBD31_29215 [Rubripirellula sp.]
MATTVDLIRSALERRDGLSEDVMAPLASAYHDDATRVNERLAEAVGLLRKGLRSEAIQRASLHPNAIDGAADLDFPEITEWIDILQFLGVDVPTLVDQDAAEQVNEAIVETQPLNELLQRHRRLAIAKAPLRWRLRVLRRIAHLDAMNPVWEEDLEAWEQARLKQVPAELDAAIREGNLNEVGLIRDELTQNSWRVEPSKQLVDRATGAAGQFSLDAQVQQLTALAPKMHDAFAQFDEPQARLLRDQWRQVQSQMKGPGPVELLDDVAPVLAWLEQLDNDAATANERRSAMALLESALDQQSDAAKLQRCYQKASRFDEPMPMELEQRYRSAIAEQELRAKRKTQAILGLAVAATILIASLIGYWQWRSVQQRNTTSVVAELKSLLEQQKFEEAGSFFAQIQTSQPNVALAPEVVSLSSQLTAERSKDQERQKQFQRYLEEASNEDPAKIDSALLAKADDLAVSETEKAAVFEIKRRRNLWESDVQQQHTRSAMEKLDVLSTRLATIEEGPASANSLNATKSVMREIEELGTLYPQKSLSSKSEIDLLETRATKIRDAIAQRMEKMDTRLGAVAGLVKSSSLPDMAANLKSFAEKLPSSPMSKEFTQAASEAALWDQVTLVNRFLNQLRDATRSGISSTEATGLMLAKQGLAEKVANNPALESLSELDNVLQEITQRESALATLANDIGTLTFAELLTLESPGADDPAEIVRQFMYYSHFDRYRDRFKASGQVGIEIVVDQSGAVENRSFVGPLGNPVAEPRDTVRWLLSQMRDERSKFLANWDESFLATAAALRKRPNLDSTVKEILLTHLLEGAAKGSDSLGRNLKSALQVLNGRTERRQRWFAVQASSSELDDAIERLVVPEMSKAYRNRNVQLKRVAQYANQRYQWIGILLRDDAGRLVPQTIKAPESAAGEVFVMGPDEREPTKAKFSTIGTWADGSIDLGAVRAEAIAGRPLFFLSTISTTEN